MEFTLPLRRWALWDARWPDNPAADVSYIDPLLRRRLSPLARSALDVAQRCIGDLPSVSVVYASRHGELTRTIELLHSLRRQEPLSPATFSLSVLNAAAGVFSIARHDTAPATAISAGVESLGLGLLDTFARLQTQPDRPVLFIYAEAPVPAPLSPQMGDPEATLALALLLDPHSLTRIHVQTAHHEGCASAEPQALSFIRALSLATNTTMTPHDEGPLSWLSGHRRWTWCPLTPAA
jgi:hypothetical protein